jgi:hypothetical protein
MLITMIITFCFFRSMLLISIVFVIIFQNNKYKIIVDKNVNNPR